MAAAQIVDEYLAALPGELRRLAHAEWGITVPADAAGGWPLDVGVRIAEELLRVQAFVAPAHDAYDPWGFLWINRRTRLVRFGCTQTGDIWVHGDVPAGAVDEKTVDRLLGLVVEAAVVARDYAVGARGEKEPARASWLSPAGDVSAGAERGPAGA